MTKFSMNTYSFCTHLTFVHSQYIHILHHKNTQKILCNGKCEDMVFYTKSIVFKLKWFSYLIFLLLHQFDAANGQFTTTSDNINNGNSDEKCNLDDTFTFGLSLTYAGVSIISLIGVSYWSFKSMTGLMNAAFLRIQI